MSFESVSNDNCCFCFHTSSKVTNTTHTKLNESIDADQRNDKFVDHQPTSSRTVINDPQNSNRHEIQNHDQIRESDHNGIHQNEVRENNHRDEVQDNKGYTDDALVDYSKSAEEQRPIEHFNPTLEPSLHENHTTNSKGSETKSLIAIGHHRNVGDRVLLSKYVASEWTGSTPKAETIKKGYDALGRDGMTYLRQIRGDNYCGLRACLFQALRLGITMPNQKETYNIIEKEISDNSNHWLTHWNFGNRLLYNKEMPILEFMEYLLILFENKTEVFEKNVNNERDRESDHEREEEAASLLNSNPTLDEKLMEALKLHMLANCIKLFDASQSGDSNLHEFVMLMFARDTSSTPNDFMVNHLNHVGDSGGLEQVEMCLLGYTLGECIKVYRIGAFGSSDFVCSFPDYDDNDDSRQYLIIVAEDDRHYNVVTN